jgi:hypothetical protein
MHLNNVLIEMQLYRTFIESSTHFSVKIVTSGHHIGHEIASKYEIQYSKRRFHIFHINLWAISADLPEVRQC